ncbi:MAG: hypothetical protein A3F13_04795 [Gammaproteobacteria bacterium RIFCSPHIGHO2_12_FULL_40_19]|nr:MAG: hypothetical protein A3F13_04795 [Gammaproteobacteria bacterium RIFCSPHIGHO2_12_FULL_40_19]
MMLGIMGLIVIAVIAFFVIKPILIKKHLPQPVIINTDNQPTIGAAKATVHIVAFEDLKCSNCARFNKELMPYIRKHFIDTGIATYTMINLAFIDGSMPAANAAHCVYKQNSTLFFDYTDYIFEHQPPETENWATIPTLLNFANKVKGINTQQLAQCLIKSPYDQLVHANLTQAMQLMNGNVATPTLYINGIIVTPLTKSQINKIVEVVK